VKGQWNEPSEPVRPWTGLRKVDTMSTSDLTADTKRIAASHCQRGPARYRDIMSDVTLSHQTTSDGRYRAIPRYGVISRDDCYIPSTANRVIVQQHGVINEQMMVLYDNGPLHLSLRPSFKPRFTPIIPSH